MLERFWENVHVKNPILDEVQVNDLISRITRHGFDSSGDSCLVLLMCALGLITRAFRAEESVSPGSSCYLEATSYFRAAQQRVGLIIMRGGLSAAQCLFFSGIFSATVFDKWTAWRYFSQSLACCQQFISPAMQATLGPGDLTSDKQAVYWSAWKSELEIRSFVNAADFPLPDHLTYPSFFPSPPEPTDTAQSHLDSRIITRQNVGWFFCLLEISMRRLSTRISQDLLSLHASPARSSRCRHSCGKTRMDMDCRLARSLAGECWLRGFRPEKGGSVLLSCPEVSMSALLCRRCRSVWRWRM
jgi:hypothetical protein